ncbi:MAG TPA: DUF58 domain-containing protein, partial [Gammaproteobacteria bacterium]|nr:DUF58 domain-containing protein [Gammaproteobacteria bacterium]
RRPPIEVERQLDSPLSLGAWREVRLSLRQLGKRPLDAEIFDHPPETLSFDALPAKLTLPPGETVALHYRIRPRRRGDCRFLTTQLRYPSRLGLWRIDRRLPCLTDCRVYPDFTTVSRYELLAMENRLAQMGVNHFPRRGLGSEFHQLREFRHGDALPTVDWKATARHHKLITREYVEEHNQEIMLLIDCGPRMRARDDELSHFDHSLNAALLLAWVALRQEDAVGVATFGSDESRWLHPRRGKLALRALIERVYDLQPGNDLPDYSRAAAEILIQQKRRALIILITNLRDEDSEDLQQALALLGKRHRVIVASLREQALQQAAQTPVHGFEDALRLTAAREYLHHRRIAFERVRQTGALALDVAPDELSVQLVNQYLKLKSAGGI